MVNTDHDFFLQISPKFYKKHLHITAYITNTAVYRKYISVTNFLTFTKVIKKWKEKNTQKKLFRIKITDIYKNNTTWKMKHCNIKNVMSIF